MPVNLSNKNNMARAHTPVSVSIWFQRLTSEYTWPVWNAGFCLVYSLSFYFFYAENSKTLGKHPLPSPWETKLLRKFKWNGPSHTALKWLTWAESAGLWDCLTLWCIPGAAFMLWNSKGRLHLDFTSDARFMNENEALVAVIGSRDRDLSIIKTYEVLESHVHE